MSKTKWVVMALAASACLFLIAPLSFAQEENGDVLDIVSGKVDTLNLQDNKLVVTDTQGVQQEFVLDPNLTTVWDDITDEEKELSDLEQGKDVVVEFRSDKTGDKTASWIDIVAPEEGAPPVPAKEEQGT